MRNESRMRGSRIAVNQMFPFLIPYFEVNVIKQWPEHDGDSGFPYLPSAPYTPFPKSYISSVRFYPENNRVVLTIVHNKHCWNIGRRHHSNHIYFVIKGCLQNKNRSYFVFSRQLQNCRPPPHPLSQKPPKMSDFFP